MDQQDITMMVMLMVDIFVNDSTKKNVLIGPCPLVFVPSHLVGCRGRIG